MIHLHFLLCKDCKRVVVRCNGKGQHWRECREAVPSLKDIATVLLFDYPNRDKLMHTVIKYRCPGCHREIDAKLIDGSYKLLYHTRCKIGHKLPKPEELL